MLVDASFYDVKINWPSLSSFKTKVWPLSCLIKTKMYGFQEVVQSSADTLQVNDVVENVC